MVKQLYNDLKMLPRKMTRMSIKLLFKLKCIKNLFLKTKLINFKNLIIGSLTFEL